MAEAQAADPVEPRPFKFAHPMTLTRDDLLGEMAAAELDALETEVGGAAEVTRLLGEAEATVLLYTNRHDIGEDWLRQLARPLAIHRLYRGARTGQVPEKRQEAHEEAMRTLRDVRDGRFAGVVPAKSAMPGGTPPRAGAFGSRRPLRFPAFD